MTTVRRSRTSSGTVARANTTANPAPAPPSQRGPSTRVVTPTASRPALKVPRTATTTRSPAIPTGSRAASTRCRNAGVLTTGWPVRRARTNLQASIPTSIRTIHAISPS